MSRKSSRGSKGRRLLESDYLYDSEEEKQGSEAVNKQSQGPNQDSNNKGRKRKGADGDAEHGAITQVNAPRNFSKLLKRQFLQFVTDKFSLDKLPTGKKEVADLAKKALKTGKEQNEEWAKVADEDKLRSLIRENSGSARAPVMVQGQPGRIPVIREPSQGQQRASAQ